MQIKTIQEAIKELKDFLSVVDRNTPEYVKKRYEAIEALITLAEIVIKGNDTLSKPSVDLITCNSGMYCQYSYQESSLVGCGYEGSCDYKCPQTAKQPTKEVPDIRPILEKMLDTYDIIFGRKPTNDGGDIINQAIQEISALYRKEK